MKHTEPEITAAEEDLLNAEMQKLAPEFRMFYEPEFLAVAMPAAAKALAGDKRIIDPVNQKPNIALLTRRVVTDPKREGYGVPFAWWWIYFELQVLRGIDSDPWSEVKWWLYEELRGKAETLAMWGSQNSGKTSFMGRFAVVLMCAWTRDAVFYITGPKKSHAEDKGWKNVIDWSEYVRKNSSLFVASLGISVNVTKTEVKISDRNGTGTAKFVSAEESSAIQGKKSQQHDKSGLIGITCVVVDEFIENSNLDLIRINQNASSNHNYFQIMACNPNPEFVGHPSIREFSWPQIEMKLDRTRAFRWPTAYGLCVRFAWANCPNRIIGRSRWPYLLDEARMLRQRKKGTSAIDSQLDAWGFGSSSSGSPLDEAQIRLAGTYEEPIWTGPSTRFAVFDCAFGGEDPATVFLGEAGEAIFQSHDEHGVTKTVISAIEQAELPVEQQFTVTQEWLDDVATWLSYTGGKWPESSKITGVHVGDELNGNFSMAALAIKYLYENDVPPGNATFDSSQRGDCTSLMISFLGEHNVRWFYEGSRKIQDEEKLAPGWYKWPYEYERGSDEQASPKLWSSLVTGTISMIWFLSCELIKRGFLVNGENCKRGLNELCARPVVKRRGSSEGKRDVISKDELKKLAQKSPTYAETLAIACYFVVRFLGIVKIDEPRRAPSVVISQAVPFNSFVTGKPRAFSRFGPQRKDEVVVMPPRQPSVEALAEMNAQGLKPVQEMINAMYAKTI